MACDIKEYLKEKNMLLIEEKIPLNSGKFELFLIRTKSSGFIVLVRAIMNSQLQKVNEIIRTSH